MPKFTDNAGREWNIHIDVPAARMVRKELGADLLDLDEGLPKIYGDPVLLCDVLYLLCREQSERAGVSDEEFGRGLRGEVLGDACSAFLHALMDFFPPRQREMLAAIEAMGETLMTTLHTLATKELPELMMAVGGESSPDTPQPSDTNQPEPCANSHGNTKSE